MVAACSGWRGAAKWNSEWIADSRALAGAHAVVPVVFDMVEERRYQVAVDVVDVQRGWPLDGSCGGETE